MDPGVSPGDVFAAPLLGEGKTNTSTTVSMAQPPEPQRPNYRTATGTYRSYLMKTLYGPLKFVLIFAVVGVLLAIPVIVINSDEIIAKAEMGDIDAFFAQQTRQVLYYIFGWLLVTWIGLALCFALGTVFPYIFRFVARYVNPAHQRYWRILRTMRKPFCIAGTVSVSYIAYAALIFYNRDNLAISYDKEADQLMWIDIIEDFLQQGILWAWFYFIEKIAILYVTIHYHNRSDLGRITHSKNMQNALMALYKASTYLYPVGTAEFAEEDMIIGNATGSEHGEHRVRATRYLSRLGVDTYGLTSFFGNFLQSDPDSHWLRPASSYAVVERAIANPKSAAALGRRIWMSLVPVGKESLTAQDIAEVLGPFRKDEAAEYFKTIDEGEIGDIRLEEMEWTAAEAGRIRNNIYKSMHQADHCINTFDWVMLASLAGIMIYFILVFWVPALKDIQETLKFLGFGLTFALGRTLHHFLAGCIFILFDHPYDIGDRVELWSGQSNQCVSLVVVRTSLLYTVFKRVDNWMELQAGNEWLQQCRIENVTRSGANRQPVTMLIDINTSFKDLQYLRSEMESFLKQPENKRDYMPNLALGIVSVGELTKLELRCIFTHRTNWSNEPLRAARSMKFMCALVAALRRIPIRRPDTTSLGLPENPAHYVPVTTPAAADTKTGKYHDFNTPVIDLSTSQARPFSTRSGVSGVSAESHDEEIVRRAVEESERRRREQEEKEAEELAARQSLSKMPAVARKGPPARAAASQGQGGGRRRGFRFKDREEG
ncbi:hypothetical protein N0V88_000754 [Collariella sp. IMI 366227]|nr:hypothetical protein N0V88_000754 [Collariella sp. IMI 366227]